MSTFCMNRTLISNAMAGTGANVSLLIDALTPLCPKPKPSNEIFANQISTVVIGYVFGFLPWGFVVLFDFISAKWRSVRKTRRLGYLHIAFSVFPMVAVIWYAVIQAKSEDYKEMMTAVIAVVFTLYHIARTAWGLAELHEYKSWCEETLKCIWAAGPKSLQEQFQSVTEGDDEDEDEKEWKSDYLDKFLLVNSDVVDNEFTGRDVSVHWSWRDRALKIDNPMLCTVRWAVALQCSHGDEWRSNDLEPLHNDLVYFLSRSLMFSADEPICFVGLNESNNDSLGCGAYDGRIWRWFLDRDRLDLLWTWAMVSIDHGLGWAIFLRREMSAVDVFFRQYERYRQLPGCGVYGSRLDAMPMTEEADLNRFRIELDNITSSFPTSSNRVGVGVEKVEYLLASRICGSQNLTSISSNHSKLFEHYRCERQLQHALDILQNQIRLEKIVDYCNLHWLWKLVLVPQLSHRSNAFVFQSSALCDAAIAIAYKYRGVPDSEIRDEQLVKWKETFREVNDMRPNENTFAARIGLPELASNQRIRFYSGKIRESIPLIKRNVSDRYFVGVSLDSVRTLLAHWILRNGAQHDDIWNPSVPNEEILVHLGELGDPFSPDRFGSTIILACQHAVQRHLKDSGVENQHLPSSHAMIVLLLLSYPSLHIEYHIVESKTTWSITPMQAPCELSLSLTCDFSTSNTASLKLTSNESDMKFDWQLWINTALGLIKSHNQEVKKNRESEGSNRFVGPLDFIKNIDLSREMHTLCPSKDHPVLSKLPGELKIWLGWPIFDVRFCQFELDQWMDACGPLPSKNPDPDPDSDLDLDFDSYSDPDSEYERRKSTAVETLTKIANSGLFESTRSRITSPLENV